MLFNVIFGNEKLAPDEWVTIEENGYRFYEKADIRQRVRIDPNIQEPKELEQVWASNSVQAYDFGGGVRFRPNGRNMNGVLRPIINQPNVDQSQQILIFVTVMNNYHLIDFNTDYQILGTYHASGKWQGAIISLTTNDIERKGESTILTFYSYNRKKEVPNMCTVSFTTKETEDTRVIDADHVVTKVTPIKDKDEKERVMKLYNDHKGKYLGFKCITDTMQFVTSTYIVGPEYGERAEEIIPSKRKEIIYVPETVIGDDEALGTFISSELEGKKIRAVTLMGIDLPLKIVQENRLLYVFKYNETYKRLDCIKSN